jgi:hypothetical protein
MADMSAQSSDHGKCLYETGIDAQKRSGSKDPHVSLLKVGKPDAPEAVPEHNEVLQAQIPSLM